MWLTIKCATIVNQLFNSQLRYHYVVSSRYYCRWSHRRPVKVIEDNITEQKLSRWKLKEERKVFGENRNKTFNVEADSSVFQHDKSAQSISQILKTENAAGETSVKAQKSSNSNDLKESNFKEQHSQRSSVSFSTIDSQMFHSSKNNPTNSNRVHSLKNNPKNPESEKEEGCKSAQVLEKRRIYYEKEIKRAQKLIASAEKLQVPLFTDLGENDSILSTFLSNTKSKKRREKEGRILLEGKRLIRDAVDAGIIPEVVFFSRVNDLRELNLPHEGVKIYKIIYKKLCIWSDTVTPQGILAIVKIPDVSKERPTSLPLTIVCDNIRDPGNLGTILRTCAGIGCQKVILTKGCVNLWEPKVLRAAAGAHFRMSISQADDWNNVTHEINDDSCVCIAENITKDPISNHLENLKNTGSSDSSDSVEENLLRSDYSEQPSKSIPLPIVPYYALDYPSLQPLVLIVGGETEGVSPEAYQYASETSGLLLNIPLSNNLESLNSGIALGVVAFEIKKQFLLNRKKIDQLEEEKCDDSRISKSAEVTV